MHGKDTIPTRFWSEGRLIGAAQSGNSRAVEYLVTMYPPVRSLIGSLKRSVDPHNVAPAELEAAGRLAVLEALRGFDRERGVRFTTYAYHFIRGAMLAELYPHVERRRDSQGTPNRLRLVSFDEQYDDDAEDVDGYERELHRRDPEYGIDPGYARVEDVRPAAVRAFVGALPDNQRTIVEAVFWGDRTHAELAAERGVSRPAITRTLTRVFAHGEEDLAEYRLDLAV